MQTLVTGVSGFIGAALAGRLQHDGHAVRGFARSRERALAAGVALDDLLLGDFTTGAGLERALDGVDVAYYLVHSMEGPAGAFADAELRSVDAFARAAAGAGLRRVVFLGGLVPAGVQPSRHLASRLAVERILLDSVPEAIALRASIVVGERSRSFRFLVRLIERMPVMALPAWRENRTAPIDGRDVLDYLVRTATVPVGLCGRSWDIAGPEVMTYAAMVARIADALMIRRPALELGLSLTPVAAIVAAAIAGEDPALIEPLMESLEHDLLPRDGDAAAAFGVHLHGFDAAVERALRDWERTEELAAR
ncbi:MAG TPA: NAD-dependent epimerase/dehydratase family protein [Solirubrobacteraceae bacterium]|nr:NAD-dependent epimerase/dehydratase family protein [Solirubrobacteraceae bacterium]